MNNKSGSRSLASMAGVVAAGILMAQAAWAVFDSAAAPAGSDLEVARVVPEGDQVPAPGRQIVVTFDRPVVALGSMAVDQARSPVGVSPSVDCQWHWLDPRSLACELNAAQALAPATRYAVTVAAGITAQDGAKLKDAYRWSFSTIRPAITGYSFRSAAGPRPP
jgi:alpha-2-macroglobulin